MNKKISIIIPCYNSSKYVNQTLYSALNQTYDNYEVIAVDNESTDNTLEILNEIKVEYPNLIISTAPNVYKHSSKEPVEEAYKLMTGEYFTILDSDDFISKDYLLNNINFINNSKEKIFALQSPIMQINSDGGLLGIKNHDYNNIDELKKNLLNYCCINSPTVFYSKELLTNNILTERPDLYSGFCDYDKFCRIVDNGYFIHTSPIWLGHYYRWHNKQDTWSVLNNTINFNNKIQNYWKEKWSL